MPGHKKNEPTELSQHDRKILEKYTGFFTNFIESNTAKTEVLEEYSFDSKKQK